MNHIRFNNWRKGTTYKLQHTGQVIYLEKVLNERFSDSYDASSHQLTKEIWISDGEQPDSVYLALEVENDPRYGNPIYLGTIQEYEDNYSDFIINVPSSIIFQEPMMRALVDYYKLAGKFYLIKIV